MNLSKSEEQLMSFIWELKKAYMKDLIAKYDEPVPANTTIATLLKRMTDKGYIGFETKGRSRQYFPLVKKGDYVTRKFNGFKKQFFGDSTVQFSSFFTQKSNLSTNELEELKSMIEQQLKKKKS